MKPFSFPPTDDETPSGLNLDPLASIAGGSESFAGSLEEERREVEEIMRLSAAGDVREITDRLRRMTSAAEVRQRQVEASKKTILEVFARTARIYEMVGHTDKANWIVATARLFIDDVLEDWKPNDVLRFIEFGNRMLQDAQPYMAQATALAARKKAMESTRQKASKYAGENGGICGGSGDVGEKSVV